MVNEINLGEGIVVDLNKLIDTRLLIQANSGGSFTSYLSNLRTNGLVETRGGMVKASQEMFP